jgi:hypothetical protein
MDLHGADLVEAHLDEADLNRANLEEADLAGAHLAYADLSFAQLCKSRLGGVELWDANMLGADLRGAYLYNAQMQGARLEGADLGEAVLRMANLTEADLTGVELGWTNLTGSNLARSELRSASMWQTVLGNVNLAGARGLDKVRHQGPSTLDERTLRQSWPLPDVFLRGCGLSDDLIRHLPSLLNQAIEFYSCFISYSSRDQAFAYRLHADLQNKGVRCWFAPEDLRVGDKFRARIDEAIRLHDKLLLILSEHSVHSPWVEEEVEAAFEKERKAKERGEERTVLFPIRLDDAVMASDTAWAASIRRTRHIGDFRRWKEHDAYQRAFERLLRDLKSDAAQHVAT